MKYNETLERIKTAILGNLSVEGICQPIGGFFLPMPLGKSIADDLNRMFKCKGWTPSQAHCLDMLLRDVIQQAKEVGRALGLQEATDRKSKTA